MGIRKFTIVLSGPLVNKTSPALGVRNMVIDFVEKTRVNVQQRSFVMKAKIPQVLKGHLVSRRMSVAINLKVFGNRLVVRIGTILG